MSLFKYSTKEINENMARAVGRDLPISMKHSVNVCKMLRGKNTEKAKKVLEDVISLKKAVPYKRYKHDLSHKKRIGPGRFPVKTCAEILKLVKSVEANAQFKGLNTSSLVIRHLSCHIASRPWHFGRRRRRTKRSHVEIVVEEVKEEKKEQKGKKEASVEKKESARKAPKKQEQMKKATKEEEPAKND